MAMLENEIYESAYKASIDPWIHLQDAKKTWRWQCMAQIQREDIKTRKTARIILLNDYREMHVSTPGKMKYDPDWYKSSTSYNPLQLLLLIDMTFLDQTKNQYPFAMFYEQECSIYSFSHNTFSNEKWYEWFSTNVDVGSDIDVTRQEPVLLYHVSEESNNKF